MKEAASRAALLRLGFQPDDEAFSAPKLYVVTINQLPGLLGSVGVTVASKALMVDEMTIGSNRVGSIVCHPPAFRPPVVLETSCPWWNFDFTHKIIAVSVRFRT
jgi:hypothetical protein